MQTTASSSTTGGRVGATPSDLVARSRRLAAFPTAALHHDRRILDALDVAVYITDECGRITFFNRAAEAFWGRRPELGEAWCGAWRLYWPDGRRMAHSECPLAVALEEDREVRGGSGIIERPDGSRISFVAYPTPLHDDVGRLVGAVNVLVDVTERKRAEDALRASNAVKDEFLGLVSHELRTPVTTIFGNAQLLSRKMDRLSPEDRSSMLADIAHDSSRLLGIIENLLHLTRLEAGTVPDPEPQVLDRIVGRAIDSFRARHRRQVTLRVEAEGLVVVEADAPYLELLMDNLLSNADKYSPVGESVDVVVGCDGSEGQVRVLDRGIGVADDDRLFSPFYRSDAAKKRADGVGIGLAVCKRVVESQGGRIWACRREGGGSEFGFALPLAREFDAA